VIVNTDPLHGAPTGAPNLRLIPAINMALLTECWHDCIHTWWQLRCFSQSFERKTL